METTRALRAMHDKQIRREPWPAFEAFETEAYPVALRERTARQWWRRAREEYGSVHEFSALTHALCQVQAPIELTGALARLITDEARHAELCRTMARTLAPALEPEWARAAMPYPPCPLTEGDQALLGWAADVVMCACCIGETISRPLYDALSLSITDPVPRAVVAQILRDEHLHATFGWECLAWLMTQLEDVTRLQTRLSHHLAGFERSSTAGFRLEDLVAEEAVVEAPGPDAPPNLGRLSPKVYATIFYATLESEVLPRFEALGFDAMHAWRERARSAV